jgi:hypothetical protein
VKHQRHYDKLIERARTRPFGLLDAALASIFRLLRVLSHRVSITMEADFCIEALEEALARHGRPEIFNTDQGSQFTSAAFTDVLLKAGVAISMQLHVNYAETVLPMRDGLPKVKDFPAEMGGSGEIIAK